MFIKQAIKKPRRGAAGRLGLVAALLLCAAVARLAPAQAAAAAATPPAVEVGIDNFTFAPKELHVAVGTTVTWVNHDDIPHNVVSVEPAFKSPVLDTKDHFSFTFAKAGKYPYYCGLHPRMTGEVVVE
jgi:amicyanin